MKKQFVTLLFIWLTAHVPVWAQSTPFGQAMTDALQQLDQQTMKTPVADLVAVANRFERIAGAEPTEWLPRYYAGLLYVYCGFAGKDAAEKDRFLDKADTYLAEAQALAPNNDELAVLGAYIAQSRMTVDPMNRWQTYGAAFSENIARAKSLNPANPRPYVLEGIALMYTPEQYGGGPKTACPVLASAAQKLDAFQPVSGLHPSWGRRQMQPMLAQCGKQ